MGEGAADALGVQGHRRKALNTTLRRELRHLARSVGYSASHRVELEAKKLNEATGNHLEPVVFCPEEGRLVPPGEVFDVLLEWCSTPLVPTYSAGMRIILGLGPEDEHAIKQATEMAWVLRLLCFRDGVNEAKDAPILHKVTDALCELCHSELHKNVSEAVHKAATRTRRVSFNVGDGEDVHRVDLRRTSTM